MTQARLKPADDVLESLEPPTEIGGKRRSAEGDPTIWLYATVKCPPPQKKYLIHG